MNQTKIKSILENLAEEIDAITDDKIKSIQKTLFNLIETLVSENDQLREENQRLRDENNRLKGEQGKPDIRKQTQENNKNISSEKERNKGNRNKKKKSKNKKRNTVKIDRVEVCDIDKNTLPSDAEFKGYKTVVVQDLIIRTDNVEFKKAIYYSPSLKKTFMASAPPGYEGEFGPFLKALIMDLNQTMSQPAIVNFLNTHGTSIVGSSVSRILMGYTGLFHQEKNDIVAAGLSSSFYQQMDDTGARVNGKNHYTHVLCNQFYTAYFTRPDKSRLTILEILTQGDLTFDFNESAYSLMEQMNLSAKTLIMLRQRVHKSTMNRQEVDVILAELFPDPEKHKTNRQIILDASAIMGYRKLPHAIGALLTDNAPQYNQIVEDMALCWVHDGRHYKKLSPVVNAHIKAVEDFLDTYWEYYHKLLAYKKSPNALLAEQLSNEFDTIFSTETGYEQLDERIKKTKMKKDLLLLVLEHPELPLHNNTSELGARRQARYRDVSMQTKNKKGTEAKDTRMTITETAKKLFVNTFNYFYDRITRKFELSSLASLVKLRTMENVYNTS
jgi:hypothetical protein